MAARNHRDKEGLLPRERVLVDEYVVHKNGRRAAVETLGGIASRARVD